jgi:hypothetical protein
VDIANVYGRTFYPLQLQHIYVLCYIWGMNTNELLEALDSEINRLQQVRNALSDLSAPKRRGRPKAASAAPVKKVKRTMSAAGRKRVAEAQRERWANHKAAAKKAARKTTGKPAKKAAKKKAAKKATRRPAHKVTVTRVPAKKRTERKSRVPKKAPSKHALSSASEIVAAPKASQE